MDIDNILIPDDNCLKVPGEHCGSCLADFEDNYDSDMNCCNHMIWRAKAKAQIEQAILEARIDELKELAITPHITDELKDAVAPYYLRRARELTKLLEKK